MSRPHALLRAGFPFLKTLGMRRVTNHPTDVAVASDDTIYILNRHALGGHVTALPFVDPGENWDQYLPRMGPDGRGDGEFIWPVAMVLDEDQTLFISDEELNRITLIDREGAFISKWGEPGDGDGELKGPAGIAIDRDSYVYVADALNHRVQKFTKQGKFVMSWGEVGQGDGQFNMPWGICVDENNDVYVADWRNDRIQKFDCEGKFLFSLGMSGTAKGEFQRPGGVDVDAHGDIYVADTGNDRVQQFDQNGRYLEQFFGDATLSDMSRSYLMTNAQSLRLRETSELEPQKRFRSPRAVRVDDKGRMFVADFKSYRVQVYQKEAIPLDASQIAQVPRSPTLFVN